MNRVAVVETGLSNVDSILRAVQEVGGTPYSARRSVELGDPDRIILPGVGSFAAAVDILRGEGLADALVDRASAGVPILGICLGMQVLASWGEEGGGATGLGLIPGQVHRLEPTRPHERVPHVGWNQPDALLPCGLFNGIEAGTDFYFVHSYCFAPDDPSDVVATTPYCGGFASVVGRGTVLGVQFHPEKSHRAGLQLLRNFLEL